MALALLTAAEASTAAELRLRERVTLSAPVVRLVDVAEVVAADGERSTQLAALPLMPSPAPGTRRYLQRREIVDLLAAHGVDLDDVRFDGAEQVELATRSDGWKQSSAAAPGAATAPLNRHAAILAGQADAPGEIHLEPERAAALRDAIDRLIADYLDGKASLAASWRVRCAVADRQLALVGAATSPLVCEGGAPPWTGRQRFVVSFDSREGPIQLPVYAEVSATSTPVVVAARPIARGEPITAAHLEMRSVDYLPKSDARRAVVGTLEELIGMEARQAIRAGDVVFTHQVQAPVLVKRGEVISVSSQAGGIRVRTTARAREDGVRGELVQLESLATRERFVARVVGPREAAVFAHAAVETALRPANSR
jgi:flagella basal body P-ring formation protein FlgA